MHVCDFISANLRTENKVLSSFLWTYDVQVTRLCLSRESGDLIGLFSPARLCLARCHERDCSKHELHFLSRAAFWFILLLLAAVLNRLYIKDILSKVKIKSCDQSCSLAFLGVL